MTNLINPFKTDYYSDAPIPKEYVKIFSGSMMGSLSDLFSDSHVVLMGVQGCGKTMLLDLFDPNINIEYKGLSPIDESDQNFIGFGINLLRSGIAEFGQVYLPENSEKLISHYFADFLNYTLVLDLLKSLELLGHDPLISKKNNLDISQDKLNSFASDFSQDDCWYDFFGKIKSYNDFKEKLNERTTTYKKLLDSNIDDLPESYKSNKTSTLGTPVQKIVEYLRKFKIVQHDTRFFARIDQYEELSYLERKFTKEGTHLHFREVIHKMMNSREAKVFFKIGTRRFSWPNRPNIFETSAALEQSRNYTLIDIDQKYARLETGSWIFPKIIEDIFRKRIERYYESSFPADDMLKYVFGSKFSREEKLDHYLKTKKIEILKMEDSWPQEVKSTLKKIFMKDPLSAKLGEAWVRQKINKNDPSLLPTKNVFPWENKPWWIKERIAQALLQIAAGNQQSLMWACKEDIKNLSSGNILIFTNVCKAIWDAWLRSLTTEERASTLLLPKGIPISVQNAGIREASQNWYNKIGTDVGDGSSRKLFAKYISENFRDALRSDKKMTYPGHNGFTVPLQELDLEENEDIKLFLQESVDYGVLVDREHTSKMKLWGRCRKFYPVQVLSPYFQLPERHTKEPKYIRCSELRDWLFKAGLYSFERPIQPNTSKKKIKKATSTHASPLLPFFDQENDNE